MVRLACFRLGIAPLNLNLRGNIARTALPKTNLRDCPRISGIPVPKLLKSLSANYRNRCPEITETRTNKAALEERTHFKLFPSEDVGVAQGSALSALAANIVLREFDAQMNDRGIVCVRYIDDFIMLAATEAKVQKAYAAAREHLTSMGMDVYDRTDVAARNAGKFDEGNIYDGTDVLGYRVSGTSRQPSSAAMQAFKIKCRGLVEQAKKEMRLAATGQSPRLGHGYHQAMVLLHKTVWGWSQAFRHTTANQAFKSCDKEIERCIQELRTFALHLTRGAPNDLRRRVMGIHLLADTPVHPLPGTPHLDQITRSARSTTEAIARSNPRTETQGTNRAV